MSGFEIYIVVVSVLGALLVDRVLEIQEWRDL